MIVNYQRRVRVPVASLNRFLARARRALRLAPESVGVRLVSDAQIASWNRRYRGKNRPTDVLSFPANGAGKRRGENAPGTRAVRDSRGYLGDIAVAPAVARRNAHRFGRSFEDELRTLLLHGLLHLLGYDHETDDGEMERRERRLRRRLGLS